MDGENPMITSHLDTIRVVFAKELSMILDIYNETVGKKNILQ